MSATSWPSHCISCLDHIKILIFAGIYKERNIKNVNIYRTMWLKCISDINDQEGIDVQWNTILGGIACVSLQLIVVTGGHGR